MSDALIGHSGFVGSALLRARSFDARYRASFERYLNFLYFFYDHHADRDSYFWTARKILNPDTPMETRTAFVRLMSGGGDLLNGDAALHDGPHLASLFHRAPRRSDLRARARSRARAGYA